MSSQGWDVCATAGAFASFCPAPTAVRSLFKNGLSQWTGPVSHCRVENVTRKACKLPMMFGVRGESRSATSIFVRLQFEDRHHPFPTYV